MHLKMIDSWNGAVLALNTALWSMAKALGQFWLIYGYLWGKEMSEQYVSKFQYIELY